MRMSDWSSDVCASDLLAAMLAGEVAAALQPHHLPDDRAKLASALKELARRHDVIVTVGGASVGDHDHVRGALDDAGGRLDFWKIAMKPGKPLIAGTLGDAVLLGLPGRSAEHTSELQSLIRTSYAVFGLKKH